MEENLLSMTYDQNMRYSNIETASADSFTTSLQPKVEAHRDGICNCKFVDWTASCRVMEGWV